MREEADGGIDRQHVLSEITSAASRPASSSFLARPASPRPMRAPGSSGALRPPVKPPTGWARWTAHRHELAAIVCAFVGVIWLSVGVSLSSWPPGLIGIAFGIVSLTIWALQVWAAD